MLGSSYGLAVARVLFFCNFFGQAQLLLLELRISGLQLFQNCPSLIDKFVIMIGVLVHFH